ncbi:TPA: hypothetical protein L7414_003487, partial [Escherichia coli]|nr:hypothetical protein [Escherichia coli]
MSGFGYGCAITQPDGSLWMSPEFTPMSLIDKGAIPAKVGGFLQTRIPVNKSCLFFFKAEKKAGIMFTYSEVNGYYAITIKELSGSPGIITGYAFADMILPHSGYGIAMYNEYGEMVYHGEMMLLGVDFVPVTSHEFTKDVGYPCAVMATFVGNAVNVIREPTQYSPIGAGEILATTAVAYGNTVSTGRIKVGNYVGLGRTKKLIDHLPIINTTKYD